MTHVFGLDRGLSVALPRLEPLTFDLAFEAERCLMRIEAEFLELPIPFGVLITQAFDIDAARKPSSAQASEGILLRAS